jgi:hypothetical protein
MTSPLVSKNGIFKVMYADDIYLDVFAPSTRSLFLEPGMMIEYEILWLDVNCYANILKVLTDEPLSLLPVDGTTS